MKHRVCGSVLLTFAIAGASLPAAGDEGWAFEVTPYIWAAGLDADVEVRNRSASVDESFSDIFDSLEFNAALMATAQYGNWIIFSQLDYLALDSDNLDDTPTRGSLQTDVTMATLGFGYQFGERTGTNFDVLVGARNLSLDNELKLDGIGKFDNDRSVTDPVLILRLGVPLSERWRFDPLVAVGGGGDSESTYELQPQFRYQANDWIAFRFGYRKLHYDIDSSRGNNFDGAFEGPFIGLGMTWGGAPKKVASIPSPAPAAVAMTEPAPVPPSDADRDGVVDAADECPRTPSGQRVDSIGCGYHIQVEAQFDIDSAIIKPQSYEGLDVAASLLKRVPTMRGVIEGHTDATGSERYNQALSERRAAAVSAYLIERGVDAARIPAKGMGESQPIADNETAEGRAQNRRVVLRRTDASE